MLLSEMFGVERDKPFMVIGLLSVYKIGTDAQGIERIERVNEYTGKSEVVCGSLVWRVIRAAPSGIIHLPLPLTDEQRVVLMSEDRLPCWHCRGIEAHKIAYVTAVKDKSGRMLNTPVDTPYNYCPACGRKLWVEE